MSQSACRKCNRCSTSRVHKADSATCRGSLDQRSICLSRMERRNGGLLCARINLPAVMLHLAQEHAALLPQKPRKRRWRSVDVQLSCQLSYIDSTSCAALDSWIEIFSSNILPALALLWTCHLSCFWILKIHTEVVNRYSRSEKVCLKPMTRISRRHVQPLQC
jgi:hypothetical protein